MKLVVAGPSKSVTIGSYVSYLDYILYTEFGYTSLKHDHLCGYPNVELKCFEPGEIADTISDLEDEDLSLFDIPFLNSFYDGADPLLYILENPTFMTITYQNNG